MKMHFVTVIPKSKSVEYVDTNVKIEHFDNYEDNVNELIATLNEYILDNQSIILHRNELLRFVDAISDNQNLSNKELFNKIRRRLRMEYDVCRIRFNPRTMALHDKTFIIHKRIDLRTQ